VRDELAKVKAAHADELKALGRKLELKDKEFDAMRLL
jgi:hypothetical protein